MVIFTIDLQKIRRVRAQQNETVRGWYETQRGDTSLVKISDNIVSTSSMELTKHWYSEKSLNFLDVAPTLIQYCKTFV